MDEPLVAVVLPPREGFGPGRTGALGMLARRYATTPGFRTLVIGGPQDGPSFDVPFQAVRPSPWLPLKINVRYVMAMIPVLRRENPAIIEVHNRPGIAMMLARWFPHIPVSLLLNNDPIAMSGSHSVTARLHLLRRLKLVMTSSGYLRDRFMQGIDPAAPGIRPVELLMNCLDIAEVPPPVQREKLILFAGRVVADKGPDSFIQACAEALESLEGWRAEIIGADGMGPNGRETEYLRGIRAMSIASGVRMTGYRDHPLVLAAMSRAGIVIVPSRWNEPFGLTALEALACGAPLLVSSRGGLPEVVGDAGIYIDPDDPSAVAAEILALAGDPERCAALSAAGRDRARAFDTPIAAARLAEYRRSVLNGR